MSTKRVTGELAVSRALGDLLLKNSGPSRVYGLGFKGLGF